MMFSLSDCDHAVKIEFYFLWPVGGAMSLTPDWHVDVTLWERDVFLLHYGYHRLFFKRLHLHETCHGGLLFEGRGQVI